MKRSSAISTMLVLVMSCALFACGWYLFVSRKAGGVVQQQAEALTKGGKSENLIPVLDQGDSQINNLPPSSKHKTHMSKYEEDKIVEDEIVRKEIEHNDESKGGEDREDREDCEDRDDCEARGYRDDCEAREYREDGKESEDSEDGGEEGQSRARFASASEQIMVKLVAE